MPRPIRRPYDPTKPVHDRRATDLTRLAEVAAIEVDCPIEKNGATLMVMRSIRNDPLAAMHNKKLIDEAQYHGGRAYQHDFETAERGPQAIDPSKEYVDGGKPPEPISEAQRKAVIRLAGADRRMALAHGIVGLGLVRAFLIDGWTMDQICSNRTVPNTNIAVREKLYIGRRIRECLNELAVIYGFAMGGR